MQKQANLAIATVFAVGVLLGWLILSSPHATWADEVSIASERPTTQSWGALKILDTEVQPGTKQRFLTGRQDDFAGRQMAVPVWIVRGQRPGRTLCVTAGIHGDELNGVEIARRIFVETDPQES